jgi:hypothetical protein
VIFRREGDEQGADQREQAGQHGGGEKNSPSPMGFGLGSGHIRTTTSSQRITSGSVPMAKVIAAARIHDERQ